MESSAGEDFWHLKPRQLVALASAFAFATSLVVYEVDKVVLAIICLILLALKIFDVKQKHITALLICFVAGALNAILRAPHPDADDISKFCGQNVKVEGVVLEAREMNSGKGIRVLLKCSSAKSLEEGSHVSQDARQSETGNTVTGRLELSVLFGKKKDLPLRQKSEGMAIDRASASGACNQLAPLIQPGDSVVFQAKLVNPQLMKSPQSSRLSSMLSRKHVFCLARIRASAMKKIGETPLSSRSTLLEQQACCWRESLLSFHRNALGAEDGDLLASIVLGDKAVKLGQDITDKFRACGLSHILAASGFNLSVVAIAIYFVLRFCVRNLWIANSICFLGMLVFVVIAGPSPSVVRACLMGALLLL
ncbi:MAG: ComEC/Rec2 family competence protein, partial [Candidatus Obscuribacterales bacterium]|nr:ComEC/Rec2 family competence protein [Candidatus Obscuribacterales bacterium]